MSLHTRTGRVTPSAPFDFDKSLDYLRWFPPLDVEQTVTEESCVRAFRLEGHTILCRISSQGSVNRPA